MELFGKELFGKERNFEAIVEPLKKIESNLTAYIGEQENKKLGLEDEKKNINDQITLAVTEKAKSEHTVTKIAELLGSDFIPPVTKNGKSSS